MDKNLSEFVINKDYYSFIVNYISIGLYSKNTTSAYFKKIFEINDKEIRDEFYTFFSGEEITCPSTSDPYIHRRYKRLKILRSKLIRKFTSLDPPEDYSKITPSIKLLEKPETNQNYGCVALFILDSKKVNNTLEGSYGEIFNIKKHLLPIDKEKIFGNVSVHDSIEKAESEARQAVATWLTIKTPKNLSYDIQNKYDFQQESVALAFLALQLSALLNIKLPDFAATGKVHRQKKNTFITETLGSDSNYGKIQNAYDFGVKDLYLPTKIKEKIENKFTNNATNSEFYVIKEKTKKTDPDAVYYLEDPDDSMNIFYVNTIEDFVDKSFRRICKEKEVTKKIQKIKLIDKIKKSYIFILIFLFIGIIYYPIYFYFNINKTKLFSPMIVVEIKSQYKNPKAEMFFKEASKAFENKNLEKTIEYYSKSIELEGGYPGAYNNRAVAYIADKQYNLGINDLKQAIKIKDDFIDAYINLGNAYYKQNQYALSLTNFNKAIELKKDNANSYYSRALLYFTTGHPDLAITDYTSAIKIKRDFPEAYYNLGVIYQNSGLYEEAIKNFNKAIELKPDFWDAYLNCGTIYEKQGLYDKAINSYSLIIRLKSDYVMAYNNRGNAYHLKGQYEEAIKDFNKAIELKPDFYEGYYNRGNTYRLNRQYDEAVTDFNKVIELKPDFCKAYQNRGISYYKKGIYSKAINDLKKSIELEPNNTLYYINMAIFYFETKDYKNALQIINKSSKLNAYNANKIEIITIQALSYYALGDTKQAIEIYQKVIIKDKKFTDIKWVKNILLEKNLFEYASKLINNIVTYTASQTSISTPTPTPPKEISPQAKVDRYIMSRHSINSEYIKLTDLADITASLEDGEIYQLAIMLDDVKVGTTVKAKLFWPWGTNESIITVNDTGKLYYGQNIDITYISGETVTPKIEVYNIEETGKETLILKQKFILMNKNRAVLNM